MLIVTYEYNCDICGRSMGTHTFHAKPGVEIPQPYITHTVGDLAACHAVLLSCSDDHQDATDSTSRRGKSGSGAVKRPATSAQAPHARASRSGGPALPSSAYG